MPSRLHRQDAGQMVFQRIKGASWQGHEGFQQTRYARASLPKVRFSRGMSRLYTVHDIPLGGLKQQGSLAVVVSTKGKKRVFR
eukprot:4827378-Pleurochrysis_carterae.AAC.2